MLRFVLRSRRRPVAMLVGAVAATAAAVAVQPQGPRQVAHAAPGGPQTANRALADRHRVGLCGWPLKGAAAAKDPRVATPRALFDWVRECGYEGVGECAQATPTVTPGAHTSDCSADCSCPPQSSPSTTSGRCTFCTKKELRTQMKSFWLTKRWIVPIAKVLLRGHPGSDRHQRGPRRRVRRGDAARQHRRAVSRHRRRTVTLR